MSNAHQPDRNPEQEYQPTQADIEQTETILRRFRHWVNTTPRESLLRLTGHRAESDAPPKPPTLEQSG